jgi:hypothetical protein
MAVTWRLKKVIFLRMSVLQTSSRLPYQPEHYGELS